MWTPISEFATKNKISRQLVEYRIKTGKLKSALIKKIKEVDVIAVWDEE